MRSVLITGCSSGIGYACALGLRERGYRVFASARAAADVRMLAARGFEALQLDVADSASINAAVEQLLAMTGGRLYGLFNNAGYSQPGAVEDLGRDALREQFETNVFGLHELTCKVLPVMRAVGYGRIVHNSSILGLISMRYRGAYQASKFAVEALADTLRQELCDTAIRVSIIEPGPVQSRFRENAYVMFKRHIDTTSSAHRDIYKAVERRLAEGEDKGFFTLPETAVLKKLIHALEHPRPNARYYVTLPTYLMGTLKRLLSTAMMDRVLLAVSRSELK
ncbi:MAG: NAD(P)-dependent dehydrogenase (short-subunit alcohol dehydrogenase family) [Gammaproteobacteria bacterium]|jgi:NAD(P)-dependent dehydrogenase (short-subunit alcohol dehydrogenase family)